MYSGADKLRVLIGSRALAYWYPDKVKIKPETDWDIISEVALWENGKDGYEWHNSNELYSGLIANHFMSYNTVDYRGYKVNVMSTEGLKIIKRSHLWRDLKFTKHILQYQNLKDIPLGRYGLYLLDLRTAATMQAYPQPNPNLNQTVQAFFDDAVTKKYSHDWLHELYAYEDKPLYTKLQKNPELAWCSKDLWYNLSAEQKLQCVAEEAYVIATERFLVPADWKFPAKLAYLKAVDKICTTLCSGYFRDHAIDNYTEILNIYSDDKIQKVHGIILETSLTNSN